MGPSDVPDYVAINRDAWTRVNREHTDAKADQDWSETEIRWGLWWIPERQVQALPELAGKDVIELGCGTAYFGSWIKRAGARRVVGVDVTPAQLSTARRLNDAHRLGLELLEANAESVPLPDASFDLAVSEYGASIWCDPYKWIPEAARLLRPLGELVFLRNSTLSVICSPDTGKIEDRLVRPQRDIYKLEWRDDDPGVEFHLATGALFRLLRETGFELLDLIEIYPPDGAKDHVYYDHVTADWAKKWPSEEIWRARKR